MDDNEGASIYGLAKGEYTKQLTLFLVPTFHRYFMNLLKQAETEETNPNRHLRKFQELLETVPDWNIDKVARETSAIITQIHCDYLEELVTAVFIAHTKILTAIRIGAKNKKVQITIPKLDHFIHRALSECSRLLWSSVYLFNNEQGALDKQRSHRQVEALLHEGVGQAIRGLLPVKSILKDYLAEPDADADADDDDDDEKDEEKTGKEDIKDEKLETKDEKDDKEVANDEIITSELTKKDDTSVTATEEKTTEANTSDLSASESVKDESSKTTQPVTLIVDETPVVPSTSLPPIPSTAEITKPTIILDQTIPTLVVNTEPSVQFSNYDQVIKQSENGTEFQYIQKNRDADADEDDDDDEDEDFEEIAGPLESMTLDDFEELNA